MRYVSIFHVFLAMLLAAVAGCQPAESQVDGQSTQAEPTSTAAPSDQASPAVAPGPQLYDEILSKYVQGDYFSYGSLLVHPEDLAKFDAFLQWQAEANLDEMTRDQQIAFYINAYNSCCIKAVLDHYPVHSPLDIDGFFDELQFTVAGEELTISEIEYERLIANHQDMRAHFAVVCSDRGCLPLKDGAYTGETLDEDLEAAAEKFVGDQRHFSVDPETGEVQISKIFEWYGEKFLRDPVRPVEGEKPELYLLPWVDDQTRELLESGDYQLKIIEWNWTLNELAGQ